jgi:hypothetical protein
MGRLSEAGRRMVRHIRGGRAVKRLHARELSAGREGMSDRVAPVTPAFEGPYECGVCGRLLLTGEDHGRYCVDGRRTVTCSLCDIELAAAGFVRADQVPDRSRGSSSALADCA